MDNLPELRDIHLPDGVSVFPLAYGWWLVLATIVVLPFLLQWIKSGLRKSRKLYALHLLKRVSQYDIIPAATKISELLRRICVYKYPEALNLFSKEWISFLNKHCKKQISDNAAELLSNAPYIKRNSSEYNRQDLQNLIVFCKEWIGENL